MFGLALALAFAAAPEPPAPPPASGPNNQPICRGGGQRTLGSHIRTRRRCLTAEQWRRLDEEQNRPTPGLQVTEGQNDGRAPVQPR